MGEAPPSGMVMKPSEVPPRLLRFPDRKRALPARRPALSASTEDARLTWPVRVLSVVAGLMFAAIGFGLLALFGMGFREGLRQGTVPLEPLLLLPVPLGIALYGIVLGGRGIVGRPWARRALGSLRVDWVIGTLLGLLVVSVVVGLFQGKLKAMEAVAALFGVFLQLFFHELGHLAAARFVGYRPQALMVGPLFLRVDGPRVRFSFNRSWLQLFAGLALYEPKNRTAGRDLWVAFAGPLTNFLLTGLALEVWGWPGGPSGLLAAFLRTFIGFGFAMGFLNLIPLPRVSGFALDGREILDILRGRHSSNYPL